VLKILTPVSTGGFYDASIGKVKIRSNCSRFGLTTLLFLTLLLVLRSSTPLRNPSKNTEFPKLRLTPKKGIECEIKV